MEIPRKVSKGNNQERYQRRTYKNPDYRQSVRIKQGSKDIEKKGLTGKIRQSH